MKHSFPLVGIILLCLSQGFKPAIASTSDTESDRLVLLDFKNQITQDPGSIMSSWNDSVQFCNWTGITCNSSNGIVVTLNLEAQKLAGSIPPSIGNLTFLTGINLIKNSFHGEIPQEIGRLLLLQDLNLSFNLFGGKIPTNLTHCTGLKFLDLVYNQLVGQIPDTLSSLLNVIYLGLGGNNLTGSIPAWIGNFSSLSRLSLALNNLEGSIPNEFGQLSSLGFFQVYGNKLSGEIPSSIYNISSIYYFSVTQNQLQGSLPPDVGFTLPNLTVFAGGVNNFTGSIPVSLSNASGLQVIDFAQNSLTGTIPVNFGSLKSLYRLNFDQNRLGNNELGDLNFLAPLANCTNLEVLGLAQNQFGGVLPSFIGNLSNQLKILTMGSNLIHGSIPVEIGNLINLTLLGLEGNLFTGNVPDVLGKLQKLEGLYLNVNSFSGPIPSSLGNLTSLTRLFMEENRVEGNIPPSLGNCSNLQTINLSSNNLIGNIPKQVIGLSSLSISLAISHNSLTGSLPFEVGSLKNLVELDISYNKLSGEIPSTLSSCVRLERLFLEGNSFQGLVPQSLEDLRGLADIDLSHNHFSGKIPDFLGKLSSLRSLNLSFNDFTGEVPTEGIFTDASAVSIIGNDNVCGGVQDLHLPACSKGSDQSKSSNKSSELRVVIPVTVASIILIVLSCSIVIFFVTKRSSAASASLEDSLSGVSYSELSRSTSNFLSENLIGSGSFGSVYKGILPGDKSIVAVKVLNLEQQGASESFMDECKALRSVRHRNLLKLVNVCSGVDHQGNEFKALVFELMSNGSLDQWLHPTADDGRDRTKSLKFLQRLNIAIDVASALDYLHHYCETQIVHCDLKPSNVLLDDDLTAHVGDFGLARFLFEPNSNNHPSKKQTITAALKGSIGYIPPEYGMGGQLSVLGDVYSFGILLLEIFTGKRPTDEMFKEGLSIDKFVALALPEHVMDVVDSSLVFEEDNKRNVDSEKDREIKRAMINDDGAQNSHGNRSGREECLLAIMRIGLLCSRASPRERMPMNDVVNKMQGIREEYIGSRNNRSGR